MLSSLDRGVSIIFVIRHFSYDFLRFTFYVEQHFGFLRHHVVYFLTRQQYTSWGFGSRHERWLSFIRILILGKVMHQTTQRLSPGQEHHAHERVLILLSSPVGLNKLLQKRMFFLYLPLFGKLLQKLDVILFGSLI